MKYLNKKGRARFVEVEDFGVVDLDRVPVSIEKDGQHFTLIWDGRSQHQEDVLAVIYHDINPHYGGIPSIFGNMDANVIREINEGELAEEINYIKYRLEDIEKRLEGREKYELEETKYHAKIKVWDNSIAKMVFWCHNEPDLADYTFDSKTMEEWAEIGINETNAEFYEVKYKKF